APGPPHTSHRWPSPSAPAPARSLRSWPLPCGLVIWCHVWQGSPGCFVWHQARIPSGVIQPPDEGGRMTVTLTAPGKGEEFTAGPVRFRILEDGTGVDRRFAVAECHL